MPDHGEVHRLASILSPIPQWFKGAILCLRWSTKPGVKVSQCNKGKKREICAKLNTLTEEYMDRTDKARGGGGVNYHGVLLQRCMMTGSKMSKFASNGSRM